MSRRTKSTIVKCNDACTGCELVFESIPRTMQVREIWGKLSPACDAEQRAMRDAAHAEHRERTAIRSLTEELI
jgi:hypothetical protein